MAVNLIDSNDITVAQTGNNIELKIDSDIKKAVTQNTSDIADAQQDITNLENGNVYSTNEVDTGEVWTDGKKIYRQCIEFSNIAQNTATTIATISNIDTFFVNTNKSYCTDGTTVYPLPKTHLSNINNQVDVRFTKSSGVISLGCGSANTARSGVLTVEYTKTTD